MTTPTGLEIRCANKNQQGIIVRIGGRNWSMNHTDAIVQLMENELRLHIFIGDTAYDIGVRGDGNDAYLVLEPDGQPLHKIDGLQSC